MKNLKKLIAVSLAVVICFGCTACGKEGSKDDKVISSNSPTINKDSESESNSSLTVKESSEYKITFADGAENILSDEQIRIAVENSIKQLKAVKENDFEAYKKTINISLLEKIISEHWKENVPENSEDALNDIYNFCLKKSELNQDIKDITEVSIEKIDESDDIDDYRKQNKDAHMYSIKMVIYSRNSENFVVRCVVFANENDFTSALAYIISEKIEKRSSLALANCAVKTAYSCISGFAAEQELKGNLIDFSEISGTISMDGNSGISNDELNEKLRDYMSDYGGEVYIGTRSDYNENNSAFFVQWRKEDGSMIGQYPSPPDSVEKAQSIVWGEYQE